MWICVSVFGFMLLFFLSFSFGLSFSRSLCLCVFIDVSSMGKVSHVVLPFSTLLICLNGKTWNSCDMPQFISLHIIVPLKWRTYVKALAFRMNLPLSNTLSLPLSLSISQPHKWSGHANAVTIVESHWKSHSIALAYVTNCCAFAADRKAQHKWIKA